jgi:hypothetical protein
MTERRDLVLLLGEVDADVAGESVDEHQAVLQAERLPVHRGKYVEMRGADHVHVRDLAWLGRLMQLMRMGKAASSS